MHGVKRSFSEFNGMHLHAGVPSLNVRSFSPLALLLSTAVAAALLASCGGGSSSPGVPPAASFVEYTLADKMVPSGPITVGSDGALWLIASLAHNGTQGSLWRVTTSGAASMQFSSYPSQILPLGACTTGPDGAVWFFALGGGIGSITPSGSVRFFPLPANANIDAMTAGPDGAVWFTDTGTHALGRITTAGAVSEYPTTLLPYLSGGIAAGSDGALWFTSYAIGATHSSTNDLIGRYAPATGFQSFPVTPGSAPTGIAAGSDGALWYTEDGSNRIGRMTTAGKFSEYVVPSGPTAFTEGIANGRGNALWFVTGGPQVAIGEITTAGAVTLTPVPSQIAPAGGIAATPDGSLWLSSAGGVVRLAR